MSKVFSFMLILCVGFMFACHKKETSSVVVWPEDAVTRLRMLGAKDAWDARPSCSRNINEPGYYSVGYKVEMDYPPESVIKFYRDELTRLGYKPYKDSKWTHGQYEWQTFYNGTETAKPCVSQYIEDWINKDRTRIGAFIIRYESNLHNKRYECSGIPDNSMATVCVISMPYSHRVK